uniref:Solute carrier organic anion transporter family member n=1 Tax=Angiostrongylus cantonensis TaxID=6313 RepID=A0A0K0D793_ANGCA
LNEAMNLVPGTLAGNISTSELRKFFSLFVRRRRDKASSDLFRIRRSAVAPFTYCGQLNLRCSDNSGNKSLLFILLPALFFLGIGRTMPWSLGIPLVDDNVKRRNLPVYFAGMSFVRVLGPISGFLLGSFCNKLYYTLHPPVGITPSDPAWIGAWWIGFIFIGAITLFPSVALFLFPVEFKRCSEQFQIFCIPTLKYSEQKYMLDLCSAASVTFWPSRVISFSFQTMFGVFGFALGTIIGGIATHRYRLNGRRAAMFVLVVSTVNMGLFFLKAFIACESVVNSVGLNGRDNNYNFTHACNSDCGCADARLYPVCDLKGYKDLFTFSLIAI